MTEAVPPQPDFGEQQLFPEFTAGQLVLRDPELRAFTRGSIDVLGDILGGEKVVLLPLAAEVAMGDEQLTSNMPATDTLQVMAYVRRAVEELDPKSTEPSREKIRHELDWKATQRAVKAAFARDAALVDAGQDGGYQGLERKTTEWYTKGAGRPMVETTYAPDSARKLVAFSAAGAKFSPINRQGLLLASLAGEKFRTEKGLTTSLDMTLDGEDGREAGWLSDEAFRVELREEVRRRIDVGEISPTILFGGSADDKRILKGDELHDVEGYRVSDIDLLYPEKEAIFEADAMLSAAWRVWGGVPGTLRIVELPADPEKRQNSAKLVTFQSSLGVAVTGIFTIGEEARIRGQLNRLADYDPTLFEGKDALAMGTGSIYRPSERPVLLEFGIAQGFDPSALHLLGHSAHAAGIHREIFTLVGEQAKGLRAVENVARRTAVIAEEHMVGHVGSALLGGVGVTER